MPSLLIIDDHTCGSRTLVQKLRSFGYDVQVALDADEAIGLYRLYAVDAVIMDCHVESTDGRTDSTRSEADQSRYSDYHAVIFLSCSVYAVAVRRCVHSKR
jgi:CheY-like chemotaxis protein